MKKIFLALAVVAAFASCADDNLVENEGQGNTQQMTFVASMDDDASTRTTIDSDNKVLWSTDDAISILGVGNTANSQFTLSSGANTTKGTFTGSCATSTTGYYAAYPYNEANGWESGYVKIHWDGSAQVAQDCYTTTVSGGSYKTYYPEGTPMLAYTAAPSDASSKTVSMQFKHICAYFKVFIHTSVKAISISANTSTDALTAEDILVSWNGGAPKVEGTVNPSNQVTLTGKDGATLEPGCYYIPVLPATITSGITLTIVSGSAGVVTRSSTGDATLVRNNIYDLGEYSDDNYTTLSGAGTEADPYLIRTAFDLNIMHTLVNFGFTDNNTGKKFSAGYYKQTANITYTDASTVDAIGCTSNMFKGTYDGGGYTISNPHYTSGALFGSVQNCTIKNLTIKDPDWDQTYNRSFSALVETAYGDWYNKIEKVRIDNVSVTGTSNKSVNMAYFGAIVGNNFANLEVSNCSNSLCMIIDAGTRTSDEIIVGGIVCSTSEFNDPTKTDVSGVNSSVKIYNCRNRGSITLSNTLAYNQIIYVGGIMGRCEEHSSSIDIETQIYNCVNDASITVNNSNKPRYNYVGGIAGEMKISNSKNTSLITNCINNGAITNGPTTGFESQCGGILGHCEYNAFTISMCANTGALAANFYGAIIGTGKNGTMKYCYNVQHNNNCHYLAYPEGGDASGIKTATNCNVNATISDIPTTINDLLSTTGAGVYAAWKYTDNTYYLDLDFNTMY